MNISASSFMFFFGISVAGSIRVGNALGANEPKRAKMITHLALGMSVACALISGTVIILTRSVSPMVSIYTCIFVIIPSLDLAERSSNRCRNCSCLYILYLVYLASLSRME